MGEVTKDMARKIQMLLVCDVHEGEVPGQQTISFGLSGSSFEIDLCDVHAQELRDAFEPFVEHARRAGTRQRGRAGHGQSQRERSASIREWARERGIELSERGRIPAAVAAEYDATH